MAKKSRKAPKSPTPAKIVRAWHNEIVRKLKPWYLEKKCFTTFEPLLKKKIKSILATGVRFTPADMKNSLRVAGDMARICKILQPSPHPKEVGFDTFQAVLKLCSKRHQVCRSGSAGAGGWCNV